MSLHSEEINDAGDHSCFRIYDALLCHFSGKVFGYCVRHAKKIDCAYQDPMPSLARLKFWVIFNSDRLQIPRRKSNSSNYLESICHKARVPLLFEACEHI